MTIRKTTGLLLMLSVSLPAMATGPSSPAPGLIPLFAVGAAVLGLVSLRD